MKKKKRKKKNQKKKKKSNGRRINPMKSLGMWYWLAVSSMLPTRTSAQNEVTTVMARSQKPALQGSMSAVSSSSSLSSASNRRAWVLSWKTR